MVTRYDIGQTNKITLVMRWREGQVTFEAYDGTHTLDNLPPKEKFEEWTTPPELGLRPDTGLRARFHINLWLGNFYEPDTNIRRRQYTANPGPTDGAEVDVIIRNFEFQQP